MIEVFSSLVAGEVLPLWAIERMARSTSIVAHASVVCVVLLI